MLEGWLLGSAQGSERPAGGHLDERCLLRFVMRVKANRTHALRPPEGVGRWKVAQSVSPGLCSCLGRQGPRLCVWTVSSLTLQQSADRRPGCLGLNLGPAICDLFGLGDPLKLSGPQAFRL